MRSIDFLIVEDKLHTNGVGISSLLSEMGCTKIRIVHSPDEAVQEIERRQPDIVITDILFDKKNSGLELGSLLYTKYHLPFIYTTSDSDPGILKKIIMTRPSGYLVNPFRSEELMIAIELALFNFTSPEKTDPSELNIKQGRTIVRLFYPKIMWAEANGNYTVIHLAGKDKKKVRIPFSEFQKLLNSSTFLRVHRSYIINKKYLTEVKTGSVFINTTRLPVGRTYQKQLLHLFK